MNLTEHLDCRDAIAREATAGPWRAEGRALRNLNGQGTWGWIGSADRLTDLSHIAQSDPTTSLLFSDVVRAAEDVCTVCSWRDCGECKFSVVRDARIALHNHLEGRE